MLLQDNNKKLDYDKLKITTMTMVFILNKKIDIMSAFHLLPITLVDDKMLAKTVKNKLPKHDVPGSIISMNFRGMNRGLIRNCKKFFKNSINLDISTTLKNINLKLSPEKVQLCGAVSRENGIEAVTLLLNHLQNIKGYIDQLNNIDYQKIMTSINHFKGAATKKHTTEIINSCELKFTLHHYHDDFLINHKKYKNYLLDEDIINYIQSLSNDMTYFNDYYSKIKNLLNFKSLFDDQNVFIKDTNEVMVNYNYNLGFKINRDLLNQLIDGKNGFISNYDNALVNNVTIELPYEHCYHYNKRKNKIPHHTFLVYFSGAVTQSGPNSILMKEAFNLFIQTIEEIKKEIML